MCAVMGAQRRVPKIPDFSSHKRSPRPQNFQPADRLAQCYERSPFRGHYGRETGAALAPPGGRRPQVQPLTERRPVPPTERGDKYTQIRSIGRGCYLGASSPREIARGRPDSKHAQGSLTARIVPRRDASNDRPGIQVPGYSGHVHGYVDSFGLSKASCARDGETGDSLFTRCTHRSGVVTVGCGSVLALANDVNREAPTAEASDLPPSEGLLRARVWFQRSV